LKKLKNFEERSFEELSVYPAIKDLSSEFNLDEVIRENKKFYSQKPEKKNTFILALNKPAPYDKCTPGQPFMHTEGIFKGVYRRKLENWFVFNFAKFEYPSSDLLDNANTFIITGSTSSAYDFSQKWIEQGAEFTARIYKEHPSLKILAICFGE
jgi:hypothetical protein